MTSIIIATYERHDAIVNTVLDIREKVGDVDLDTVEVIVVDQSAEKNQRLIDLERTTLGWVRYITLDQPGLPNARNIGINLAKGEICIFVDDDVIITQDFVCEHIKLYADPSVGSVAGRVIENSKRKTIENKTPSNMFGINIFGRACPNAGGKTEISVAGFRGCNFSFKKCIVKEIGYFDLRYEGSALLEETDYAYRIRKAGHKIIFSPRAELFHLELPSGGCRQKDELKAQYWRIRNTTLFYLKNMPHLTLPLFLITFLMIALKKANSSWKNFTYLVSAFNSGYIAYRNGVKDQ